MERTVAASYFFVKRPEALTATGLLCYSAGGNIDVP